MRLCFYFNFCFFTFISGFLISYGYMVSQCKSSRCYRWTNRWLFILSVMFLLGYSLSLNDHVSDRFYSRYRNTRPWDEIVRTHDSVCVCAGTVQHIEFLRVMHTSHLQWSRWVLQAISVCNGSLVTGQAFLFFSSFLINPLLQRTFSINACTHITQENTQWEPKSDF